MRESGKEERQRDLAKWTMKIGIRVDENNRKYWSSNRETESNGKHWPIHKSHWDSIKCQIHMYWEF